MAALAHDAGALFVVGVDPTSLGILDAPTRYGADIVCGELQPLGIHMHYGGGLAGFVASPDEERFVSEYPTFLIGLGPDGRRGRVRVRGGRLGAHVLRAAGRLEGVHGDDAVPLGDRGRRLPRARRPAGPRRARARASWSARTTRRSSSASCPASALRRSSAPFFKEFVVDFGETGRTVEEVNRALRVRGIFGGKDLSSEYPELGQSALYSVTEVHTKADIDRLADELAEVLR